MTSKAKSLKKVHAAQGVANRCEKIVKAATSRKTAEKYAIKRLAQYL